MADKNSIFCPNCNQRTNLETRAVHKWLNPNIRYEISECNGCDFFFLVKRCYNKIESIYPNTLPKPIPEKTPDFLKDDLKEVYACLTTDSYRAVGVMARRALQKCCIKKGAPNKKLQEQIDWLLEQQIITKDLKEWAHEVRLTGNDAAHPPEDPSKDDIVTREDAEDILLLLEGLIQVLYITPALTQERRQRRKEP